MWLLYSICRLDDATKCHHTIAAGNQHTLMSSSGVCLSSVWDTYVTLSKQASQEPRHTAGLDWWVQGIFIGCKWTDTITWEHWNGGCYFNIFREFFFSSQKYRLAVKLCDIAFIYYKYLLWLTAVTMANINMIINSYKTYYDINYNTVIENRSKISIESFLSNLLNNIFRLQFA